MKAAITVERIYGDLVAAGRFEQAADLMVGIFERNQTRGCMKDEWTEMKDGTTKNPEQYGAQAAEELDYDLNKRFPVRADYRTAVQAAHTFFTTAVDALAEEDSKSEEDSL